MNKLIYLCVLALISQTGAAPSDKFYTLKNIKLLGENCFTAIDSGKSDDSLKREPIQDKNGYGNVI